MGVHRFDPGLPVVGLTPFDVESDAGLGVDSGSGNSDLDVDLAGGGFGFGAPVSSWH